MQYLSIYQGQRQSGASKAQAARYVLDATGSRINGKQRALMIARIINQFEARG